MKDKLGYCPECGSRGVTRADGHDVCAKYHIYKTQAAVEGYSTDLRSAIECAIRCLLVDSQVSSQNSEYETAGIQEDLAIDLEAILDRYEVL
jgi:hypothetical protein